VRSSPSARAAPGSGWSASDVPGSAGPVVGEGDSMGRETVGRRRGFAGTCRPPAASRPPASFLYPHPPHLDPSKPTLPSPRSAPTCPAPSRGLAEAPSEERLQPVLLPHRRLVVVVRVRLARLRLGAGLRRLTLAAQSLPAGV